MLSFHGSMCGRKQVLECVFISMTVSLLMNLPLPCIRKKNQQKLVVKANKCQVKKEIIMTERLLNLARMAI